MIHTYIKCFSPPPQKREKWQNRLLPSSWVFVSFLYLCAVAEVSSPALTSLGPFLWWTFVTLRRAVCRNRLLTTSAVPSLHTAQIPNTATFTATRKPEDKTESNSMRITCNNEWKVDLYTLYCSLSVMCMWINVSLGIFSKLASESHHQQKN